MQVFPKRSTDATCAWSGAGQEEGQSHLRWRPAPLREQRASRVSESPTSSITPATHHPPFNFSALVFFLGGGGPHCTAVHTQDGWKWRLDSGSTSFLETGKNA